MGSRSGLYGTLEFFFAQQFAQLFVISKILAVPVCILIIGIAGIVFVFIQRIRQSSPTHIAGKDFFLFLCGRLSAGLNLFQCADSLHIGFQLGDISLRNLDTLLTKPIIALVPYNRLAAACACWFRYSSASVLVRHMMSMHASTSSSLFSSLSFLPCSSSQAAIRLCTSLLIVFFCLVKQIVQGQRYGFIFYLLLGRSFAHDFFLGYSRLFLCLLLVGYGFGHIQHISHRLVKVGHIKTAHLVVAVHVIRQPGFLHFGQITGTIVERFQVRTDGITQISNHGLGIFRELSGPFFNMIHGHFCSDSKDFRVNAHVHLPAQFLLHPLLQFGIAFVGDEAIT